MYVDPVFLWVKKGGYKVGANTTDDPTKIIRARGQPQGMPLQESYGQTQRMILQESYGQTQGMPIQKS